MSLDLLSNIKYVECLNIQIMATRILGTFSLPHTSLGGVNHTAFNTNCYPLGQVAKMLQFQSNLKLEQVSKALGDQALMSVGVYKAQDGEHFNSYYFFFFFFAFNHHLVLMVKVIPSVFSFLKSTIFSKNKEIKQNKIIIIKIKL